jgi:hypothetical protein
MDNFAEYGVVGVVIFILIREMFAYLRSSDAAKGNPGGGNSKSAFLCREVDRIQGWTEGQEKRLRMLEVGREGCLKTFETMEKNQQEMKTLLKEIAGKVG